MPLPTLDPLDPVFVALADPTRRSVMQLLSGSGGATATQLAEQFPVTRQAIAKHLQVLADAGLAVSARAGRETQWRLTPAALGPAMAWMGGLDAGFDDRVADLQRHLERQRAARATPGFRAPLSAAASKRRHP
ncbi:MAG: hypothetical protein QOF60_2888 [Actinomycetota bacterium]|nr:hypothetical protein [Actinomycetota bacterium]